MYQDQVFCFTPKGDLIPLPRGATPIDFAYHGAHRSRPHTVGAKVNGAHVPLHTPLRNGDQVEIISHQGADAVAAVGAVRRDRAARAPKSAAILRLAQRGEQSNSAARFWKRSSPTKALELTDKAVGEVAKKLRLAKADDVFAEVGRGALARQRSAARRSFPNSSAIRRSASRRCSPSREQAKPISIRGLTEGISYRLGAMLPSACRATASSG